MIDEDRLFNHNNKKVHKQNVYGDYLIGIRCNDYRCSHIYDKPIVRHTSRYPCCTIRLLSVIFLKSDFGKMFQTNNKPLYISLAYSSNTNSCFTQQISSKHRT